MKSFDDPEVLCEMIRSDPNTAKQVAQILNALGASPTSAINHDPLQG